MADAPRILDTDYMDEAYPKLNKAIDNANEALTKSNTAKSTADEALSNSENTQTQLDTIVVKGDSSVEAAQARVDADGNVAGTLKERLDNADSMRLEKDTDVAKSIGAFDWWKPPAQPSFNDTDPAYNGATTGAFPLNQPTYSYDWIIERAWDKFSSDSNLSGYVTKSTVGKDQSGIYNIYRYIFAPPNYEKTIILSAAVHGWETVGTGVLSRLMHHICYDWENNPQLAYLRHKVRFIIFPLHNPWGYVNAKRGNSRTVDINRNFDYNWANYVVSDPLYDAKGSAPESEIETKYIADAIRGHTGVVAYIDFHNMLSNADNADFYIYDSTYEAADKNIANKVFSRFTDLTTLHSSTDNPSGFNFAAKNNIFSINPEFVVGAIDSARPYSSLEMTRWVEFAANLILLYAQKEKPGYALNKEPFNLFVTRDWTPGSGPIASVGSYAEVNLPTYVFDAPCDGIVQVLYSVVYTSTDAAARNLFTPLLGQDSTYFKGSTINVGWDVYKDSVGANKRDSISFSAAIPVKKSSEGQKVRAGIYAQTTAGSMEIARVRMNIMFIPSFGSNRQRNLRWDTTSASFKDVGFPFATR